MHIRVVALAALVLPIALTACANDVEDGSDFAEPDDLRDNLDLQGLYDCTERGDTGYRSGNSFSIDVVSVDGRPVEVATANAYIAMQRAAANAGVSLRIVSGFRTMAEQQHLYYCYTSGSCNNGNLAARPGYSNPQSGHALDLNTSDSGVATWLRNHGASFGFSRTVPSEAWHYEWWGNASDYDGPCGVSGPAPSTPNSCDALDGAGGTVDDGDGCFEAGGPSQYLRAVDQGNDGDLLWTGATSNATAVNFAVWHLNLAERGTYQVEAFVEGAVATSTQTPYVITHGSTTTSVTVDQTGGNRWVDLGTYDFASGSGQRVKVGDNTGEAASTHKKIVLDSIRLTRIDDQSVPPPANDCPYVKVSTSGGTLNVRRDPNTSHAPVGTLDDGVVVPSIATVAGQSVSGNADWHHVQTASLTGFVSGAYTVCQTSP